MSTVQTQKSSKGRRSSNLNLHLRSNDKVITTFFQLISSNYAVGKFIKNNDLKNLDIKGKKLSFSYLNSSLELDMSNGGDSDTVLFHEDYKFLDVKYRVVLDIGTNIGYSALYFVIKGAKKVIALKPYPLTISMPWKNIESYSLRERIELINVGYGKD